MDFPKVIEFQTHNLCNANCIICPYREIHDIKGFMHADLFERILTEVGGGGGGGVFGFFFFKLIFYR